MANRELMREVQLKAKEKRLSEMSSYPQAGTVIRRYATDSDLSAVRESLENTIEYLNERIEKLSVTTPPKINIAMPSQKSVSIPVKTDEGGLGTSTRPSVGKVPIGQADGSYLPGPGGTTIPLGTYFYFGDSTTDGSWRMYISGTDLAFERLESAVWTAKGSFTA